MTDRKDSAKLLGILQVLADSNRLRIIGLLGEGEKSVSEITRLLGQSQPLVSHHLKALKSGGLIAARREGPFVLYRLAGTELPGILDSLSKLTGQGGA